LEVLVPWDEWLRDMLCRLLKELGKDCKSMGKEPTDWVAVVSSTYSGVVPTFPTTQAQEGFLLALDQLEKCIDDPRSTLSLTDDATLRALIATLRAAIPKP
jgi:hypothetical protein